jgi:predicted GIY-YIG superfamily endonuclease
MKLSGTLKDFKRHGVYFLLKKGKVVYIGMTRNFFSRLLAHINAGEIKFDSFRLISCKPVMMHGYEIRWIQRFRPKHNQKHIFKWIGSKKWGDRRKVDVRFYEQLWKN